MNLGEDQRGYLNVDILGVNIAGMLDSGATHTLVGSKGLKALYAAGLKMRPTKHSILRVANRQTAPINGEFYVPFKVAGKTRVVTVLFVPSLSSDLILGLDFWKRYNLVPDFVSQTVEISAVELLETPPELEENNIPEERRKQLEELLAKFNLALDPGKLGCVKTVPPQDIDTTPGPGSKVRYSNVNPKILKDVHEELDDRLKKGAVEPATSTDWQSPLLVIPKRDGGWRWVVDFRELNKRVVAPVTYPLPRINPILSNMKGAAIISTIDLKDAYLQIPLSEEAKPKTAFYVPGRGLFQFARLPAGLIDAANRWQRVIEQVLSNNFTEFNEHVIVYMDDLLIWSKAGDWDHHLKTLEEVFTKLVNAGITINLKKSKLACKTVKYLGHIIDEYGVRPDPAKVAAVANFPRPQTVRHIRQFLGLANWMRKFVPDFSAIAKPLNARLERNAAFIWTDEEEGAFVKLKEFLIKGPVLRSPDFSKKFKVYTDGSAVGTGGILVQEYEDGEHAVAYTSRSLRGREKCFSATELECLGVLHALEAFRPYIEGYEIELVTDHSSLMWLHKLKNPSGRLARWAVQIQQYRMTITHQKGKKMQAPDALSRNPVDSEEPRQNEQQPEVALIDLPTTIEDRWYLKLVEQVEADPDSYDKFRLQDGVLCKLITVHPKLPLKWVQVIPREGRQEILKECHDATTSGHSGEYRTFHRLRHRGYWPNMRKDVHEYVQKCQVCQQHKTDRRKPPGFMGSGDVVSAPIELMSGDLIGPLPRSSSGHTFISVFVDAFSKYVFLRPLRKATAPAVTRHFKEDVIMKFGAPRLLLVDNGQQYRSKDFQALCNSHHVKIRYNLAYNPRSNPTERLNQTLETMICCYVQENHRSWDRHLVELLAALNTAPSVVTGVSPHQVLFGADLILDGREREFSGNPEEPEIAEPGDHSKDKPDREELYQELKTKIQDAKARTAQRYNLRRRPAEVYLPGCMVWRKNFVKSNKSKFISKKLAAKWIGPFRVKCKVGRVSYLLEDEDGKEEGPWHEDQLKRQKF